MTDQQINEAIAELRGWKMPTHPVCIREMDGWSNPEAWAMQPDGKMNFRHNVPDYCNDLNAMHEAEKTLRPKGEHPNWREWETWACYVDTIERLFHYTPGGILHATARQRAEAFLKTVGLWRVGQ